MVWWLFCLVVITSPIWLFCMLDYARKRYNRPVKLAPKDVVSIEPTADLYVRGAALEAQFLVAPRRAIVETIELLGNHAEAPDRDAESPEELRKSFEELIRKVRL